ncbi:MAG: transposase [Nitrospirae bacterium]|nr:transposase [Nitrospirota bacterium]
MSLRCAVVIKSGYRISRRAVQGFVSSVLSLMGFDLPVPNYSTIYRRQALLKVAIFSSPPSRSRHIVIDATGLRVYGAGEWHVHKYRGDQRRS